MLESPATVLTKKRIILLGFIAGLFILKLRHNRTNVRKAQQLERPIWVFTARPLGTDRQLTPDALAEAEAFAKSVNRYSQLRRVRIVCAEYGLGYNSAIIIGRYLGIDLEFVDWTERPFSDFLPGLQALHDEDPQARLVVVTNYWNTSDLLGRQSSAKQHQVGANA